MIYYEMDVFRRHLFDIELSGAVEASQTTTLTADIELAERGRGIPAHAGIELHFFYGASGITRWKFMIPAYDYAHLPITFYSRHQTLPVEVKRGDVYSDEFLFD